MIRLFTAVNGTPVYVDTTREIAVSVIDCNPLTHARLIEVPYDPIVFNDWTEAEYVDQFALTPLRNVVTNSPYKIEKEVSQSFIDQIPTL